MRCDGVRAFAVLRRRACLCAVLRCGRVPCVCKLSNAGIVLRKVRAAVVQAFLRVPLVWVQGDVFRRSAVSRRSSRPLKINRA